MGNRANKNADLLPVVQSQRASYFMYADNNNNLVASYLAECFACGIRNSFGITLDPLSKKLWVTDNGPDSYYEIDMVP